MINGETTRCIMTAGRLLHEGPIGVMALAHSRKSKSVGKVGRIGFLISSGHFGFAVLSIGTV